MFFKKSSLKKRTFYSQHYASPNKKGFKLMSFADIATRLKRGLGLLILPVIGGIIWFYIVIMQDLPDLDKPELFAVPQATVITDRNGIALFRIFEENRQYVKISEMSDWMQNAIIAAEDQDFWNNNGIDFRGIARAGINNFFNPNSQQGASTITQQLVKNVLLTPERSYKRKIKEVVLTLRLGSFLETQVRKENPGATSSEINKLVKNRILELYLNYIFLGNNSYGVEAASQGYFGTGAKNLDILQSAVIASIPKAPSRFDPFRNKALLMGYLSVKNDNGDEIELTGDFKQQVYTSIASRLKDAAFKKSGSANDWMIFVENILKYKAQIGSGEYDVIYTVGRKDYVLGSMFEYGMISEDQLKNSFINGFELNFQKGRTGIKAPHFSMWIKEILEKPNNKYLGEYGEDSLKKGGLVIKTTLDYEAQLAAENAVNKSIKGINSYGASNTAVIHLDSLKGEILAYVGSADYYNDVIEGKNDMIRAPLQPGSTIKPLFYALGFMKLPITIDTDVFDIKFKIGTDEPQNVDGKFEGAIPMRKALAHSRNMPAIKMYFSVGEDKGFIDFVRQMGVTSLNPLRNYGYPLAIGAGDMTMLELATLYAHLSANGRPGEIDPILDIKTSDGKVLYKRSTEGVPQVIPSGVTYLIRKILSNPQNLPSDWVKKFSFNGVKFAHKTGTTNLRGKNDVRVPKDGWLATYTPNRVTIFWAGNAKPKALNSNAFGGWMNNDTRRTFWGQLKKEGKLDNLEMQESETKQVTINRFSGKLSTEATPSIYKVSTLGYINSLPSTYDDRVSVIKVDSLCMGKVSDLTPPEDIATAYVSRVNTFMPNKMDLDDIIRYIGGGKTSDAVIDSEGNKIASMLFFDEPEQECAERQFFSGTGETQTGDSQNLDVFVTSTGSAINTGESKTQLTIVKPSNNAGVAKTFSLRFRAQSTKGISTITIKVNGVIAGSYDYNKKIISDIKSITLDPAVQGKSYDIVLETKSLDGTVTETLRTVRLTQKDSKPPYLIKNQTKVSPSSQTTNNVVLVFGDQDGVIKKGTIYLNGTVLTTFSGSIASFDVEGAPAISYSATDEAGNIGQGTVDLSAY